MTNKNISRLVKQKIEKKVCIAMSKNSTNDHIMRNNFEKRKIN